MENKLLSSPLSILPSCLWIISVSQISFAGTREFSPEDYQTSNHASHGHLLPSTIAQVCGSASLQWGRGIQSASLLFPALSLPPATCCFFCLQDKMEEGRECSRSGRVLVGWHCCNLVCWVLWGQMPKGTLNTFSHGVVVRMSKRSSCCLILGL